MPLNKKQLMDGSIYMEKTGTLADRIDLAWSIYSSENYNDEKNTKSERRTALQFLVYALDIKETKKLNSQLIALIMAEREIHKEKNPEYIPGKTPKNLTFDPREIIPKKTPTNAAKYEPIDQVPDASPLTAAIRSKTLLDVNNESKKLDAGEIYPELVTTMFDAEKRAKYRVNISNGIFQQNGLTFDTSEMESHKKKGFAAYTLNSNGEISVFNHYGMEDKIAHSSMNAGAPVVAAGELEIKNGVLTGITTHSGHYRPSLFNVHRLLEHLSQQGVPIDKANVYTRVNPSVDIPNITTERIKRLGILNHKTSATQIYTAMESVIDKNINSVLAEVKTYNEGSKTKMYQFRDMLIRSNITNERKALAREFETEIIRFKLNLVSVTPENLDKHINNLDSVIKKYESENSKISQKYNREDNSGRLAKTMTTFKEKLAEMKSESSVIQTAPEEESAKLENMKKVF